MALEALRYGIDSKIWHRKPYLVASDAIFRCIGSEMRPLKDSQLTGQYTNTKDMVDFVHCVFRIDMILSI